MPAGLLGLQLPDSLDRLVVVTAAPVAAPVAVSAHAVVAAAGYAVLGCAGVAVGSDVPVVGAVVGPVVVAVGPATAVVGVIDAEVVWLSAIVDNGCGFLACRWDQSARCPGTWGIPDMHPECRHVLGCYPP